MRRKFIQVLTILITIAFIGLIVIQIYWVNHSIILREAEFTYNVSRALEKVVQKLERDQIYNSSFPETLPLQDVGVKHELKVDEPTELEEEPADLNVINEDSVVYQLWGEEGLEQKEILKQSGFMDEVLEGNMSIDIVQGIHELLNPLYLDSLLRQEFYQKGIKAKFIFGVYDWKNQAEILLDEKDHHTEKILVEGFKAQLYPNSVSSEPYYLSVLFPHQRRYLLSNMSLMLGISGLLILAIMGAFLFAITTIYRQRKIADIKNDFINNMTHELKTPISTISLACEALADPDMMKSEKQLKNFVGMINEENKRLGVLVENVLRAAILDKGDIQLKIVPLNIHELIQTVIKNIAIQVNKKGGSIRMNLNAINPVVEGDRIHLTNVIYNMIDNGIKYSNDSPFIVISTEDTGNGIRIRFKDNGVGISKENQKKIFDRLFRVPTGDVHDVKGFGLGLSYVKTIMEKHFGDIDVESEIGKGSLFTIELPAKHHEEG